jgi:hypothetical protein
MPDTLDVSRFDLPASALLNSVVLDSAPAGRAQLLAQLRDRIEIKSSGAGGVEKSFR